MATIWLFFGLGVRQNGQSHMPRLRAAYTQPLHTNFMQHSWNIDCFGSSGNSNWQMGQSSPSDLVRPFLISTS